MNIFLLSDTHFGHRKMEEYCGRPADFEQRIFKNLKQIQPDDVVIHLGDFCIGDDVRWHEEWEAALPTNKRILIRGNHDRKSDSWYYAHGWHTVADSLSGHYFNRYITFSHIPIPDIQNLNIHGHFHNNLHRLLEGKYVVEGEKERNEPVLKILTKNHVLLALENVDYQPITLERFLTTLKS